MLDLSVRHLASYATKNHTSLHHSSHTHTPRQSHRACQPLSLYLSLPLSFFPPNPSIYLPTTSSISLPPSLPLPLFPIPPTHSFIYPIPSIRPIKPQSRSTGGFPHHLFVFFVKKGSIDRAGCLRVCFSCFFLGLGSLFLCLVLSPLGYVTVNRREV